MRLCRCLSLLPATVLFFSFYNNETNSNYRTSAEAKNESFSFLQTIPEVNDYTGLEKSVSRRVDQKKEFHDFWQYVLKKNDCAIRALPLIDSYYAN